MNNTCIIVIVEFDCDLLEHFDDVGKWNDFMRKLAQRGMTPLSWAKGQPPSPVGIAFDFTGLIADHSHFAGINLTFCDLSQSVFAWADLRGAILWSCSNAIFTNARLDNATFRGDISGCDFTDATTDGIDLRDACYSVNIPPLGLPPEALATCEILSDESDDPADWPPVIVEQPLRVHATIYEVPW